MVLDKESYIKINTMTHSISDYDFDDVREIGGYCVITDFEGKSISTKVVMVLPKN